MTLFLRKIESESNMRKTLPQAEYFPGKFKYEKAAGLYLQLFRMLFHQIKVCFNLSPSMFAPYFRHNMLKTILQTG